MVVFILFNKISIYKTSIFSLETTKFSKAFNIYRYDTNLNCVADKTTGTGDIIKNGFNASKR